MRFVVVEKHRGARAKCQSFKKEISFKKKKKKKQKITFIFSSSELDRCRHRLRAYRCLGPAVAETQAAVLVSRNSSRPALNLSFRLGVECLDKKITHQHQWIPVTTAGQDLVL
jgi:hypothetical protein